MKKQLCVRCGNEATVSSFCDDCFLTKNELFTIKDFNLTVCGCGSWYDSIWQKAENLEEVLKFAVEKRIKTNNKITKISILMKKVGTKRILKITAHGLIPPCKKEKIESKEIEIRIRKIKCDNCVKLSGRYHEAVFQVRGDIETAIKTIHPLLSANTWIEANRDGINIFFLKKGEARKLAKELGEYFTIKNSFKFVGMKKGKSVIRDFYSIRT